MGSLSLTNVDTPAPRWYRKAKRIIGLLSGPTVAAFVQIFHPSDQVMATVGQVIAFLPTILELFNALLNNGEEYAPKGTKQTLEEVSSNLPPAT